MSRTGIEDVSAKLDSERIKQLKAFDETNAGVKGLVDAGVAKIPEIFKRPPEELAEELKTSQTDIQIPVIDFSDIQENNRRKQIIEEVGVASEKWGFFRKATLEYIKHIKNLGDCLFELLSLALGLKADHLRSLGCAEGYNIFCHYYPPCPEPELTLGTNKHSDPVTLTVLLQNQISGLQVLHDGQWVNVPPIPGALIINIGDLLQVLSNDKLKRIVHRVIANRDGPRISVGCFFSGNSMQSKYSPIKELTSENNPPMYREFSLSDVHSRISSRPLDEKSALDYFKL